MPPSESRYIAKCKILIEERLNWPAGQDWTQRDFEYLKDLIFEKTGTLLSLSTLKRLWKEKPGRPHPSTLNAMANFLDFPDWYAFKDTCCGKEDKALPESEELIKKRRRQNTVVQYIRSHFRLIVGMGIGVLLVILLLHYLNANAKRKSYTQVTFTSKKVVANGVPNTVVFDYDISSIKSNNIMIQQNWDVRRRAAITKDKKQHTSVYYYPGYHKARLVVDDQTIKQHHVHITTNGWLGIVPGEEDPPIYLSKDEIFQNGSLYVSPEILQNHKIDLGQKVHRIYFYIVQDFGNINGDDFTLDTRVKNDLDEGGLVGQYMVLFIMLENTIMQIPLTIPGCVGNINLMIMGKQILGKDHDLSMFGCDMSQWNNLECTVQNKRVVIHLNEKEIYKAPYDESAGRIFGFLYIFWGCGAVDQMTLINDRNEIVFEDDFER